MLPQDTAPATTPVENINANDVQATQLAPDLAQSVLSKIAQGVPLDPAEKMAASKLPPSVISKAAMGTSSPLPSKDELEKQRLFDSGGDPLNYGLQPQTPNATPKTMAITASQLKSMTPATGIDPLYNSPAKTVPIAIPDISNDTSYKDAGLPYVGAPEVWPDKGSNNGMAAIPKVRTTGTIKQPSVDQDSSPNVQAAQSVAPPSLKGMTGKDIATLIGDALDAVGVGLSARGGVNRQTMLQQKMGMQNQSAADIARAQGLIGPQIQLEQAKIKAQVAGEMQAAAQAKGLDLNNAEVMAQVNADTDVATKQKLMKLGLYAPGGLPLSLFNNPQGTGENMARSGQIGTGKQ